MRTAPTKYSELSNFAFEMAIFQKVTLAPAVPVSDANFETPRKLSVTFLN